MVNLSELIRKQQLLSYLIQSNIRRDQLPTYCKILDFCQSPSSVQKITKFTITSFDSAKACLSKLVHLGLLEISIGRKYLTTRKGVMLLNEYMRLMEVIN